MVDTSLMKQIFSTTYSDDIWNMGQHESRSGLGSTFNYTNSIRNFLKEFIKTNSITNMIDTSCGDWNWMKTIQSELCDYTGIDIVESVVQTNKKLYSNDKTRFFCSDILSYLKLLPSKSVDLVLCRHTCEHLPNDYIFEFLRECKRVAKYLLLTTKKTGPSENCNQDFTLKEISCRPINLDKAPFDSLLKAYFQKEIYDGPSLNYDPEMFIYLYKF